MLSHVRRAERLPRLDHQFDFDGSWLPEIIGQDDREQNYFGENQKMLFFHGFYRSLFSELAPQVGVWHFLFLFFFSIYSLKQTTDISCVCFPV